MKEGRAYLLKGSGMELELWIGYGNGETAGIVAQDDWDSTVNASLTGTGSQDA